MVSSNSQRQTRSEWVRIIHNLLSEIQDRMGRKGNQRKLKGSGRLNLWTSQEENLKSFSMTHLMGSKIRGLGIVKLMRNMFSKDNLISTWNESKS